MIASTIANSPANRKNMAPNTRSPNAVGKNWLMASKPRYVTFQTKNKRMAVTMALNNTSARKTRFLGFTAISTAETIKLLTPCFPKHLLL